MTANTTYPGIPQPSDPTAIIWRYMDLKKLEDMLKTSTLYLCQIHQLQDSFEGSMLADTKKRIDELHRQSQVDPRSVIEATYPSYQARNWHYVNCWCLNEVESDALWKLYAPQANGVAVQSTYQQLADVFEDDDWIGMVQYVDYDSLDDQHRNDVNLMTFKRLEYTHESEVRIVRKHINFHKDAGSKPPKGHPGDPLTMDWFESLYDQPLGIRQGVVLKQLELRTQKGPIWMS